MFWWGENDLFRALFVFLSKKINIFEGTLALCVSLSGCLELEYFVCLLLCLVAFSLLQVR